MKPKELIRDANTVWQKVLAQEAKVLSFEYSTRVEYYGTDGVQKGKVDILGRRASDGPRSSSELRFEVLSPTDDTLAVLITDGKAFMSHERGRLLCHIGEACPANVSRLLPVAFSSSQWFSLLTGGVPLIAHDTQKIQWDDCEGGYLLTLENTARRLIQKIWISPISYSPFMLQVQLAGREEYRIKFEKVAEVSGIRIPKRIHFKSERHSVDLSMEIRELWLNQVTDGRVFDLQCPDGTQRKELICR
ncbi:MAG TPA: hypothetical protein EYN66_05905 [Myxococcales bacterium]|nr:hypothetical protein [Myxococcales bacterium]